jgi:hypothetical protein
LFARYSCSTFREYALDTVKGNKAKFKKYFEDYSTDFDQEDWLNGNMEV